MEYDTELHVFIPNMDRPEEERERIWETIKILGINFGPVKAHRSRMLLQVFTEVELGIKTWEEISIHEFPTAFEMSKRQLSN